MVTLKKTDTNCTLVFKNMWAVVKDLVQRQLPGLGWEKGELWMYEKALP